MPTRVLVAFDKFKDALSAERACAIAAREIRRARPQWSVDLAPLTDGGEGFCRILTAEAGGELIQVPASGPRLERMQAPVGMVETARIPAAARQLLFAGGATPSRIAVIDMASINGLGLIAPDARDPWTTTSFGTGQLIRAAAELGAEFILLGLGGSATSDLGLGVLNALGLEFRDAANAKIRPPFPHTWTALTAIEGEVFTSIPPIAIACDVANPLLGPSGAAAVFGPQKGLRAEDLPRLDAEAARLAGLLCAHCGKDFAAATNLAGVGAAGGIGFALVTAARTRLVPGFALVSAWLDLETRMNAADIVLTGEGRFDASSLSGKGPGAIAARARACGREAIIFAGAVSAALADARDIHAITPADVPLPRALAEADRFLAAAIARWASSKATVETSG